jgi:D-3-phosphoglycerate dehydrogenase
MNQCTILNNAARGDTVDGDALAGALRSGKLLDGGGDVFTTEPIPKSNSVLGLPNVVLTPDTAGTIEEAQSNGLDLCADNVVRYLTSAEVASRVV